jgi:predicted metal-binding protein
VKKVGIIICNRYHTCAGGKCLRALRNREGAFALYDGEEVELVGYATCGACPGGNVEYAPAEMKKNGAEVIHLATGLVATRPVRAWTPSVTLSQPSMGWRLSSVPILSRRTTI